MIPKKIHQIWIGEIEMPSDWAKWCNGVKNAHPDWEYNLWDNTAIESIIEDFSDNLKEYWDRVKFEKRWSWMTDVLRFAIIHKHGGIYMDCDFKMRKGRSLNELPLEKDLILTNCRRDKGKTEILIQTCLFGAIPNHDYPKRLISNIRNISYVKKEDKVETYAAHYFTTEYYLRLNPSYSGSLPIRKITDKNIKNIIPNGEIILDSTYFFNDEAKIAKHMWKASHHPKNLHFYSKKMIPSRSDLLTELNVNGVGVEVGVQSGKFSEIILEKTPINLYLVDEQIKLNKALARIEKYKGRFTAIQESPHNAASSFSNEFFNFIYLDNNRSYELVKKDVELWFPKLKKGGVFSGYGYYDLGEHQVKKAVDEFFGSMGLEVKYTGPEKYPSFYIIK